MPNTSESAAANDEPVEVLNAEREERVAIGKAKMMVKKLPASHPRRVELEQFLRRPRWSLLSPKR